jgi:hypothetical protein
MYIFLSILLLHNLFSSTLFFVIKSNFLLLIFLKSYIPHNLHLFYMICTDILFLTASNLLHFFQ